jgi:hypothetical protein
MRKIFTIILLCSSQIVIGQNIDYKLYSKILDNFLKDFRDKKGVENIVIENSTYCTDLNVETLISMDIRNVSGFYHAIIDFNNYRTGIDTVCINLTLSLDSINKISTNIKNNFRLNKYDVILMDTSTKESLFKYGVKQGWSVFNERFPHSFGIIRISKIATDSINKKCLLYLDYMRNGLYGAGYLILIDSEKEEIIKMEKLWIS